MSNKNGFTLIELSIVLVIIGLIVGGILVGQDLIKAAEIRATVSQIEKYSTSFNSFRLKYGYLPGDLPVGRAAQLGFYNVDVLSGGGTLYYQDGDGRISPAERCFAWRHMSDAQMADGFYGADLMSDGVYPDYYRGGEIKNLFPPAKLGRGTHVMPWYLTNQIPQAQANFFHLLGFEEVGVDCIYSHTMPITPIEAREINVKMDNGLPTSGKVQSLNTSGTCITGGTQYDIGTTNGNTPGCQLFIRFD